MADQTFDVVIVGGGNKALITAMYLTKYGKMKVGIFEDRHELGGGWSCEEPYPGFMANTCSMFHVANYHVPVFWDFPEWETYGARFGYTKIASGCAFAEDDTCLVQYVSFDDVDPTQEKTARELARFSEQDAETYLGYWDKCRKYWDPALREWMFTPAKILGDPDALERLLQNPAEAGLDPYWYSMSAHELYADVFKDSHVRHGFARINQSVGWQWDLPGAGIGAFLFTWFYWPLGCYVLGGSHCLTHASQKVVFENGGTTFANSRVEKILIENDQARGIRLADGTEIEAKKAVVTTVNPHQLCFELIGGDYLSPKILDRVRNLQRDWIALMYFSWALQEPPRYKAEAWNPDVWQTQWLSMGDMDSNTLRMESSERKMFKWPSKTNLAVGYKGSTEEGGKGGKDQLFGPPGKSYTLLTEQFTLPAWCLTEEQWKEREKFHAREVIELWQKYAPNMTRENVIDHIPVTPHYTANMCKNYAPGGNWCVIDNVPHQFGKLRPIPELAGHRVPGIKHLYATGSAWHPYGAAHSAQGYNCYKVMADDLGLTKPWEEQGRPF